MLPRRESMIIKTWDYPMRPRLPPEDGSKETVLSRDQKDRGSPRSNGTLIPGMGFSPGLNFEKASLHPRDQILIPEMRSRSDADSCFYQSDSGSKTETIQ